MLGEGKEVDARINYKCLFVGLLWPFYKYKNNHENEEDEGKHVQN